MPALMRTECKARITWMGRVEMTEETIRSGPIDRIDASFDGFDGEKHSGATRPSCSRLLDMHPRGTEIRNVRQFSVLSAEEIAAIASDMGLDRIDPAWLGVTLVLEGIEDFTHIPPSSRLQAEAGTTLVIDMQNRPCQFPAKEIEKEYPGLGKAFLPASRGRRGVTAWVEREGPLCLGDELTLFIPDQRPWSQLSKTLSKDAKAL